MKQRTNTKLVILTTNLHHGLEEGALWSLAFSQFYFIGKVLFLHFHCQKLNSYLQLSVDNQMIQLERGSSTPPPPPILRYPPLHPNCVPF